MPLVLNEFECLLLCVGNRPGLKALYILPYFISLSPCVGQMNMDIPDDRKAALESLPPGTMRKMMQPAPFVQTKDPGEYLVKLKHVVDAGKDYKVLDSRSVAQLARCREPNSSC